MDSRTPEPLQTMTGPGEHAGELPSLVGGGAAHSRQASTCPVDAASPLYYLVHPQRKSLQIPSFLPAAGRPPPGSGARDWNLPLPHFPWHRASGLQGLGGGTGGSWDLASVGVQEAGGRLSSLRSWAGNESLVGWARCPEPLTPLSLGPQEPALRGEGCRCLRG